MANTRGMAAAKAAGTSSVARAGSSKPPARKKAKTSKDATSAPKRRGKISLTRLLDLPPEVFNEVATHLLPADLLSLARSNRFFRKMLLSRKSQSLWKAAIHNVPDMPECPPYLSEPAYTALIYSKTCSSCGARALRVMDPYLLVRFCNKCRDNLTFPIVTFDPIVKLLPRSHATNMFHQHLILRADFEEIAMNPEIDVGDSDWYKARKAKIDKRQAFGSKLEEFIEMMEDEREEEIEELKTQRRQQIKERIVELGWTERDMVPSPANHTEWHKLVSQAKPLTDRIWTNLYPKLLPMLHSNREHREKVDREHRRRLRIWKIQDLVTVLRNAFPPLVHVTQKRPSEPQASEPSTSSPSATPTNNYLDVKLPYPFPSVIEILAWPMVKAIVDDDTAAEEAGAEFEEIRGEFDQKVKEWRDAIERDLIEIWDSGRDDVKEEDVKPDKGKGKAAVRTTKRKGKGRAAAVKREPSPESKPHAVEFVLPEFTVTFAKLDGTTTTNLSDLSPNLQLLLRADTIFKSDTLDYTYPAIVPRPDSMGRMVGAPDGMTFGAQWDKSKFKRDDDCSAIAKVLLARMGRPDATSAEMKMLSESFRCGRCTSVLPESWDRLVHHFCKEQNQWKQAREMVAASSNSKMVYNNTHDLESENGKPFAHFMTPQESAEYMMQHTAHDMPMMRCIRCEEVGVDARYFYSFEGANNPIMEHLRDVHNVPAGIPGLHFRRWEWDIDFYDPWDDDYSDEDDSDMGDPFWDLMS